MEMLTNLMSLLLSPFASTHFLFSILLPKLTVSGGITWGVRLKWGHTFEGYCTLDIGAYEGKWTVNITFSEPIYSFQKWVIDVIAKDPDGKWICVKNKYYTSKGPYTITWHASYDDGLPSGECYYLPGNNNVCLGADPGIGDLCTPGTGCPDPNAECTGTCTCRRGYTLIDNTCLKGLGDPCSSDRECSVINSECNETDVCSCVQGYSESNRICRDVDECLTSYHCLYGTCNNTEGSFSCDCFDGWKGHTCNIAETTSGPTSSTIEPMPRASTADTVTSTREQMASTTELLTYTTYSVTSTVEQMTSTTESLSSMTSSFTSPTSITTQNFICLCYCPIESADNELDLEPYENLTVSKRHTSAARRKKESAEDPRTSAKLLGLTGSAVIFSVLGLLFASDFLNLYLVLKGRR